MTEIQDAHPGKDREAYARSLHWLYGLGSEGMKFGLERMREAMARRGHPARDIPVVHIAGTNGKGSVSAMVERGLRAAGYKTGWFSSPHLHRYAERFRIDGVPLSDGEVATRIDTLRAAALGLTFFEYSVLLALESFAAHQVDVIVLEVGLGGRLDATNAIDGAALCVVTRIAKDHTAILGDDIPTIAREKGGIFREGVPVVIGARGEAQVVLREMAEDRQMDAWCIGRDFDGRIANGVAFDDAASSSVAPKVRWTVGDARYDLAPSLPGPHQVQNGAIALATLHRLRDLGFVVEQAAMAAAIEDVRWAGRMESLQKDERAYLFDCAHNPDGCRALAAHLQTLQGDGRANVLLFGALGDKDYEAMLSAMDDLVAARVYALPPMRRAGDLHALAQVRAGKVAASVAEGIALAQEAAGAQGRVIVAGSIFLVSAVRAAVFDFETDPPIAL